MSRKQDSTTLAISAHIFKATVETVLKSTGATVEFTGLDVKSRADQRLYRDHPIHVIATWNEGTQRRQCTTAISYEHFSYGIMGHGYEVAKAYAKDIARTLVHERIEDVLSRATLTLPLAMF